MSRFRMYPTPAQQAALLEHCRHARQVWNLALEQWSMWTRDKGATPGYVEQARQLTEARAVFDWLRAGSQTVQQQALRDFDQAVKNFYAGVRRRPTWRKAGVHEGFRIVGGQASRVRTLSRRWAVIPEPIRAPGTGEVVGVDRGVTVSAALSTGELLVCPRLSEREQVRLKHLQMTKRPKPKPDPERPGGYLPNRRRAKAGLNRGILANGWGGLVRRLEQKAAGRVEKVNPSYTSQTCSVCGHCVPENRESQAVFRCVACGHQANADVNAAVNIAAGRAVRARRETPVQVSSKREPQLATSA